LLTEVDAVPCVFIAAPPPPTATATTAPGVTLKVALASTAPPPPPCGHQTPPCPAPPLLPPPTTNTRTDVTLFGTCQLQLPTVVKVTTVSPLTVVEVGTQLFALAGTGIATNNPEIKVAITVETIFGRASLTFMRTKPKITFTSFI
jgi:hypothetical protein